MSMDPGMMQQMLAQRLQQSPQDTSFGGGAAGPQMQGQIGAGGAAAQLVQKVMLMKALQGQQQQHQANAMLPGTQAQIGADPQMQALQQSQMQPMQLPQPQIPPPNGMPTPGIP